MPWPSALEHSRSRFVMAHKFLMELGFWKGGVSKQTLSHAAMKAAAEYIEKCEPGVVRGFGTTSRLATGVVQCYLRGKGFNPGPIDGYYGAMTDYAVSEFLNDVDYFVDDIDQSISEYPYEKDVNSFYGERGQHQTKVDCPYPLLLAWNNDITVNRITVHEKLADDVAKAFDLIAKAYTGAQIRVLGLDQFGGSLNVRLKRGSKKQWSMHSWGIAIDWYPQMNQLRWGRDKAAFAKPDYKEFLDIWESLGWISLGRKRNYDWMHVQAARLNP